MLTDTVLKLLGWVVRLGLLLAGLVFFASLLVAALVLLVLWLLRALWAKLTGRPVSPWTFQINRRAAWNRFYRPDHHAHGRNAPGRKQVFDAEVVDVTDATDVNTVTDIEPKRITSPRE